MSLQLYVSLIGLLSQKKKEIEDIALELNREILVCSGPIAHFTADTANVGSRCQKFSYVH